LAENVFISHSLSNWSVASRHRITSKPELPETSAADLNQTARTAGTQPEPQVAGHVRSTAAVPYPSRTGRQPLADQNSGRPDNFLAASVKQICFPAERGKP
jgi:hypothetical protein